MIGIYVLGEGLLVGWWGMEMCAKSFLFFTKYAGHLVGLNIHERIILKWIISQQSISV